MATPAAAAAITAAIAAAPAVTVVVDDEEALVKDIRDSLQSHRSSDHATTSTVTGATTSHDRLPAVPQEDTSSSSSDNDHDATLDVGVELYNVAEVNNNDHHLVQSAAKAIEATENQGRAPLVVPVVAASSAAGPVGHTHPAVEASMAAAVDAARYPGKCCCCLPRPSVSTIICGVLILFIGMIVGISITLSVVPVARLVACGSDSDTLAVDVIYNNVSVRLPSGAYLPNSEWEPVLHFYDMRRDSLATTFRQTIDFYVSTSCAAKRWTAMSYRHPISSSNPPPGTTVPNTVTTLEFTAKATAHPDNQETVQLNTPMVVPWL